MIIEHKFEPKKFEQSLCESMERAYRLAENNGSKNDLFSAYEDIYYYTKEAVKFKEIDASTGSEIQSFFWRICNDRFN